MTITAPSGLTLKVLPDAGRYTLAEVHGERGAHVPGHVHDAADEWLLVVDGELSVVADGAVRRITAAEPAVLPQGVPHAVTITSGRRAC